MSDLLSCIIVRDKNDAGIKEMCPTGYFGRSKLLQSCINFTLKNELEPTIMACLADMLRRFCVRPPFPQKHIYVLNELLNGL